MKKLMIALPLVAVMVSNPALANNDQKVAFVKKVHNEDRQVMDWQSTVSKYADTNLRQAIIRSMACVSQDPLWQSQDPTGNEKVNYSVDNSGNVVYRVNGNKATMKLIKSGNGYQIVDIIDDEGSLKQNLAIECDLL